VWQEAHPQTLWRAHSDAVNLTLCRRWLPVGRVGRLLKTDLFDEAVSDGLFLLLASRVQDVVSVDVSLAILHAAQSRRADLPAAAADVRCLPFTDGAFDVVFSNSTLDHFATCDEIVVSLWELARVLRADGKLLLTLDNVSNPVLAFRNLMPFRLLKRLGIVPYYVGATLSPRHLCRTLEQVGFEVDQVTAVMHCPRVLAVAVSRLLGRYASPGIQDRFLRLLMAFERLSQWPTRFLTGHFVAVRAVKR
jgi:SAM-dependent methyltransferase